MTNNPESETVEAGAQAWQALMDDLPCALERTGVEEPSLYQARKWLLEEIKGDELLVGIHVVMVAQFEAAVRREERERWVGLVDMADLHTDFLTPEPDDPPTVVRALDELRAALAAARPVTASGGTE